MASELLHQVEKILSCNRKYAIFPDHKGEIVIIINNHAALLLVKRRKKKLLSIFITGVMCLQLTFLKKIDFTLL